MLGWWRMHPPYLPPPALPHTRRTRGHLRLPPQLPFHLRYFLLHHHAYTLAACTLPLHAAAFLALAKNVLGPTKRARSFVQQREEMTLRWRKRRLAQRLPFCTPLLARLSLAPSC